ncbi:hypothetical protein AAFF_G00076490 [Aldrovandia affinis]|uniref:Uncharacterized protein n=1 Tax=Aldrovandia affinis TaxID=143900 RepID=A0AAD7RY18_9TELE|nr:hypothetical protein AAFF_G00076490 [Aldrovandia affinis]
MRKGLEPFEGLGPGPYFENLWYTAARGAEGTPAHAVALLDLLGAQCGGASLNSGQASLTRGHRCTGSAHGWMAHSTSCCFAFHGPSIKSFQIDAVNHRAMAVPASQCLLSHRHCEAGERYAQAHNPGDNVLSASVEMMKQVFDRHTRA